MIDDIIKKNNVFSAYGPHLFASRCIEKWDNLEKDLVFKKLWNPEVYKDGLLRVQSILSIKICYTQYGSYEWMIINDHLLNHRKLKEFSTYFKQFCEDHASEFADVVKKMRMRHSNFLHKLGKLTSFIDEQIKARYPVRFLDSEGFLRDLNPFYYLNILGDLYPKNDVRQKDRKEDYGDEAATVIQKFYKAYLYRPGGKRAKVLEDHFNRVKRRRLL